jgi:hypothetical protein
MSEREHIQISKLYAYRIGRTIGNISFLTDRKTPPRVLHILYDNNSQVWKKTIDNYDIRAHHQAHNYFTDWENGGLGYARRRLRQDVESSHCGDPKLPIEARALMSEAVGAVTVMQDVVPRIGKRAFNEMLASLVIFRVNNEQCGTESINMGW